jgi:hypothetical protein
MSDSTSIESLPGPASESANNIKMQVSEQVQQQPTPTEHALNNDPPKSSAVPITPAQIDPNSMNKVMQGLQQAHMQGMTGLASRDIPMPTSQFTQDQQIKPNYVPEPSNKDYIKEEDTYETIIEKKKQKMEQEFYKDGNMSMGGYVLKTVIFGFSFYFIMKLSKYASEL